MVAIRGEAIRELIPQRDPMIMLDVFYDATVSEANTGFTISNDTIFSSGGFLTEPGLIEHIAQSASAFAGYKAKIANEPTPLGFIGEVKKFHIHFLPCVGDELITHIFILSEALGVSLLAVDTKVNGKIAVEGQMKIYIQPS